MRYAGSDLRMRDVGGVLARWGGDVFLIAGGGYLEPRRVGDEPRFGGAK